VKRWIFTCFVILIFTAAALPALAEIQSFIKEYTYQASELDSKTSCRTLALEQVKRELLEELGTYVESTTVVADYAIEKDEIRTISAGVVQTKLLDEKWDGRDYWLKAQLNADPEEVAASIAKVRNDSKLAGELAESRTEKEEALKEVERLKAELADAKADQARNREKLDQYNSAVNQLQASDSFEEGTALAVSGDYEGAAKAYDRAIGLRPDNAKAYFNRSVVYIYLGDYARATSDLDRAMAIRPANTNAYFQRAAAYKDMRERRIAAPGHRPSPLMNRPLPRPLPADDPLKKYLEKKQTEHNIVRVNPFQPGPRLKKEDRPVRPSAERPMFDRNRKLEATDPAHINRSGAVRQPDRPILRKKTPTPDQPRVDEPQKPDIRRPGRVAPQQPDGGKPVARPQVEPVKKKLLKESEEGKKSKRVPDDREQEKPIHR